VIIWLASYPRSGNTLLRIILKACFDLSTYNAGGPDTGNEFWTSTVGNLAHKTARADFVREARESTSLHFVKTHLETPCSGDRAIYVVRDGRAAIASYQRYLRDFDGTDIALADICKGAPLGFTWAAHVSRWRELDGVLLLRFEDLASPRDIPLSKIADYIGQPLLRPFDIKFSRVRGRKIWVARLLETRTTLEVMDRSRSASPAKETSRFSIPFVKSSSRLTLASSSPSSSLSASLRRAFGKADFLARRAGSTRRRPAKR
jgi:hypothetical protein